MRDGTLKSFTLSSFNTIFLKCALLIALALLIFGVFLLMRFSALSEKIVTDRLRDLAYQTTQSTAQSLDGTLRFAAPKVIQSKLQIAMNEAGENGVQAIVVDANGTQLALNDASSGGADAAVQAVIRRALDTNKPVLENDGFLLAFPVFSDDGQIRVGAVAMKWDAAPSLKRLAQERKQVHLEGLFALLSILAGVALAIQRFVSRPLVRLKRTIQQIGEGDFSAAQSSMRFRGDEIGMIAQSVYGLSGRLADANRLEEDAKRVAAAQAFVVTHLSTRLKALSEGDLTATIDEEFEGKYQALRDDYNLALRNMRRAIAEVRSNADSIQSGAEEISRASDDLSHRTEAQAATLEETAAALDQLAASVKSAADNANRVSKTVNETNSMAAENGQVMQKAIGAMSEIEKSSDQISEIIGVIDDIAFQTNLLALNAGVEAARAGTAGKGFAVVASEVRALAQRSSDAAKQIKTLIGGSSRQVKAGVKLVDQAGEALMLVVKRVDQISELIAEIATGALEQAIGVGEINKGANNLDEVTQQNAAMVEEATAAAHMLKSDALSLTSLVAKFNTVLDDNLPAQRIDVSEVLVATETAV